MNSSGYSNCSFQVIFLQSLAVSLHASTLISTQTETLGGPSVPLQGSFCAACPLYVHPLFCALEYYPASPSCLGFPELLIPSPPRIEAKALFHPPLPPTVAWKPYSKHVKLVASAFDMLAQAVNSRQLYVSPHLFWK